MLWRSCGVFSVRSSGIAASSVGLGVLVCRGLPVSFVLVSESRSAWVQLFEKIKDKKYKKLI